MFTMTLSPNSAHPPSPGPVPGRMAAPFLELRDGDGNLITVNDNWAPDNYTAIVRGKNNTTGIGLVEIYNIR
jgi:hypothetical protein